jgi:DNA-directed RNA polymerase beta subunit
MNVLLKYFQFLLKLLVKYQLLSLTNSIPTNFENKTVLIDSFQHFKKSEDQVKKIFETYDELIYQSQISLQLSLNYKFIVLTKDAHNWFYEFNKFSFLTKKIDKTLAILTEFNEMSKFSSFKPTIYFSISFKDQLKYTYPNFKDKPNLSIAELRRMIMKFMTDPGRHRYLKTKTQLLLYRKDHEIKTTYHNKYSEKDLYTATLIPEYGSWIRFGFQKNTKINAYKYPIKNQEDELTIQLDKINHKPILSLLKEMGLTNLEIYQNLHYADFFYFDQPLLINSVSLKQPISRFNLKLEYFKNISEFSRIFDPNYYRLGRIGRLKLNNRLNLNIKEDLQVIIYKDIFAIIDKLISLTISKTVQDDIDHLKNRRVRSVGELLQNLFRIGFQRLVRKLRNQTNKVNSSSLLSFSIVNATIREFFGSSQLSQYLDQTNPLSSLTHRRRISGLGPGGFDRDRISFAVRDIHPSHYGRICPIETPEGQNVGLIASLTTCARVNKLGFLETPFWRVINGKVLKTGNPIYLTADIEDLYKIAPADISNDKQNYLKKNIIPVRYNQDFINVPPSEVDFIAISTVQVVSVAASLIPFFEHDDANTGL